VDRVDKAARSAFDTAIETVRAGTIFAHDNKQYRKWRSARTSEVGKESGGLTGAGLEAHIAQLRQSRPDLVAMRA